MCDAGSHDLVDDIFSCFFGSCNRLFYNRSCQAVDLDIHLNCGDTVMGTCYLEVHIAEEVFQALDIGQDDIIIIGIAGNQTTGNTSNLLLDRNARCHQRQCRCADRSLGGRTVGFEGLGYGTDCIREFLFRRNYRAQSLLSQCTMTDFTTSGTSGGLCLAYRVGREVIMMHVTLRYFVFIQTIQLLNLRQRSQRTDVADLSLSTGKHCGTVYSRNDIYFCSQRTDLCDCTAVRTLVVL